MASGDNRAAGLSVEQRQLLISVVDEHLTKTGKRNSEKTVKHLIREIVEWEKIELPESLSDFTIDDLKDEYDEIRSHCRLFRTYTEMFEDLKKVSKTNRGKYTMPPSAYARFMRVKLDQMKEKGVDIPNTEKFKVVATEWKALSEKKKAKFYEAAKIEFDEWKKTQPDAKIKEAKTKGPKAPYKPFELYCNKHKTEEDTIEEMREKYNNLKKSKQLSYIKNSMKALREYRTVVKDYVEENPEWKDLCQYKKSRYPLSIREFNLWMESYLDAPPRPQNTAKEQYAHDESLTMLEATDYWKGLTRKQKDVKNLIYQEARKKYDVEFSSWFEKQEDWVQEELVRSGFVPKHEDGATTNVADSSDSEEDTPPPPPKKKKKSKSKTKVKKESKDQTDDDE